MHELASSHDISSCAVKPAATANVKKDFLTTDRKIMKDTFTSKTIRA